mgnify:CR=1 FL=1
MLNLLLLQLMLLLLILLLLLFLKIYVKLNKISNFQAGTYNLTKNLSVKEVAEIY